jgi:hypothetical protein
MPLTSHINPTQRVDAPGFEPLLRTESPYFNNLNRAPKNAYDYADELNKIFSYGGYVTKFKPQVNGEIFSVYEFVEITDFETILKHPTNLSKRVGIVVTDANDAGEFWVCTFSPNFTFPNSASTSNFTICANQSRLCLLNTSSVSATTQTLDALTLLTTGSEPIAKKIGPRSIFFSGSARIF